MNQRIKALRKKLGLNQTEFGERIGVKQTTIAGYETGGRTPLDTIVNTICREFGVSQIWLRTGDGEMFAQLERDEEIASFVGKILRDESDTFKKRLILMLTKLNEKDWESLENLLTIISSEMKKD